MSPRATDRPGRTASPARAFASRRSSPHAPQRPLTQVTRAGFEIPIDVTGPHEDRLPTFESTDSMEAHEAVRGIGRLLPGLFVRRIPAGVAEVLRQFEHRHELRATFGVGARQHL